MTDELESVTWKYSIAVNFIPKNSHYYQTFLLQLYPNSQMHHIGDKALEHAYPNLSSEKFRQISNFKSNSKQNK